MNIADPSVSIVELRSLFSYDQNTGLITYLTRRGNVPAGFVVGQNCKGRKTVQIKGQNYLSSRVAWALYHGEWPQGLIDHIDCDPTNDAIGNLREATFQQNMWNRPNYKTTSGRKGVTWDRQAGKWLAQIVNHKKKVYLGRFSTIEEASAAFESAARETRGVWHTSKLG